MTDLNKIIAGAKSIERILTEQFGGTGRGMKEKLDSVRYPIPQPLQQRIAYLARLRNRCVHEEGFELKDSDDYLRKCEAVCQELQQAHAIALRVAQRKTQHSRRQRPLKLGLAVLALAAAWWVLRPSSAPSSDPETAAAETQAFAAAPEAASVTPQPAAATRAHGKAGDAGAKAAAAQQQQAAPKTAAPGRHLGLGTDVLAVESVEFGYRKDGFRGVEPRIAVTVRNTSDRTISSAMLEGRLYVGDEATPIVDTSAGSGLRDKPIYLFFRDSGLAPGERMKVEPGLFGDDRWTLPDAINAAQRTLVLRVTEVSDGRKQAFGGKAQAWPAPRSTGTAAALRPAQPTTDADEYRRRFLAGEHVVLSDSRLEIGKVDLRLEDDGFGRSKPAVFVSFANRSGVTLGSATFHLQIFVKGDRTPLVDSKKGTFPGNIYAFFGKTGLADGARVTDDLSLSSHGDWDAPDLLNAIRNKKAQAVLRLESITDGRDKTYPSSAIPVREM